MTLLIQFRFESKQSNKTVYISYFQLIYDIFGKLIDFNSDNRTQGGRHLSIRKRQIVSLESQTFYFTVMQSEFPSLNFFLGNMTLIFVPNTPRKHVNFFMKRTFKGPQFSSDLAYLYFKLNQQSFTHAHTLKPDILLCNKHSRIHFNIT